MMKGDELIEDLRRLSPPNYGWLWVLVVTGLVAIAFIVLRRRRRGAAAQGESVFRPGPLLWETALADLERLLGLIRGEHAREYAIRSTSILRQYIEARYELHAPRLTTEEFLSLAGESPLLPADHRSGLKQFLELADLLKFGRYRASSGELETLHTAAVAFVLASRPVSSGAHSGGSAA